MDDCGCEYVEGRQSDSYRVVWHRKPSEPTAVWAYGESLIVPEISAAVAVCNRFFHARTDDYQD